MKKRWRKFNFVEWRSDADLRRCSREARSMWLDVVGLIYDAEDAGRLSIKGRAPTDKELAEILGDDPRTVRRLMGELQAAGVFDLEDNFVVSRRISREELQAKVSQEYGQRGGNPALKIKAEVENRVNPVNKKPKPEPRVREDDDADASSRVKPHFIPADWKPSEALIAWAVHEFRTPNNEQLTEAEIRNEADSFVDYWTGRRDAKAKRPGWDGTFRARIREQAAAIIRARPRANGTAVRAGARVQTRFAPQVSQHDAFALAAAEAGGSERGAGWEPDHGNGPRAPSGPPRLEVIDSGDARGADAAYAGGNRGFDSQTVLPLPFAAVR
jgi:hypothetical protein